MMKQIERIREMEQRMERVEEAVRELSAALNQYEAVQEDLMALEKYYGSEDWKQDFADDEAGRLPKNLKRGVLSEDGIWNLLEEHRELQNRIKD
jgi:hypothetical protein